MDGSEQVRADRREIEEFPWLEVVSEILPCSHFSNHDGWCFCVALRDVEAVPEKFRSTQWWVIVDRIYPWGDVHVRPAVQGGIAETYPHQRFNYPPQPPSSPIPWQTGSLCLHDPSWSHGQQSLTEEPIGQSGRVRWLVERLLGWVHASASEQWFKPGERFEMPDFPLFDRRAAPFLYIEDATTFSTWQSAMGTCGLFRCQRWGSATLLWKFWDQHGSVRYQPAWRQTIAQANEEPILGIWVVIRDPPVLKPWRVPRTADELANVLVQSGFDMSLISRRKDLREAFARKQLPIALGFPISDQHGDPPDRLAWQVCVEELGFDRLLRRHPHRHTERLQAWWAGPARVVKWHPTENMSPARFHSRGLLPDVLRGKRVAVIGCGSLGSNLAESLVRGGVSHLTLIDSDYFESANLVRHSLDGQALGKHKVEALCRRLSLVSPTCVLNGAALQLDEVLQQKILPLQEEYDLIVDATASDEVRWLLGSFQAKATTWFMRLEFTAGVSQGYLTLGRGVRLNVEQAIAGRQAFHQTDVAAQARQPEPVAMEDIGCWSEVFPARHSRVAMMAQMLWEDALAKMAVETNVEVTHHLVRHQPMQGARMHDWCLWSWSSQSV